MRSGQKKTTKTTLRSEGSGALKKHLTEPTLLEMSGKPTNQALTLYFVVTPVLRAGTYSPPDD
jgi:hypothetical protein